MGKKIASLVLSVLLVFATCSVCVVSADDFSFSMVEDGSSGTIDQASYQMYTVTSGENGHTVTAAALTFDPADGCIAMAFSGYSGTSATLAKQYDLAVNKYGYDVIGVINGSFFTMDNGGNGDYGTLVGDLISNGKIASAHVGFNGSVVAFGSDGSMNIVTSSLKYQLFINGTEIKNSLYYFNKTTGSNIDADEWSDGFYYYDISCGRVCDTFEICPGYEVVCKKVDNTDLIVGGTLLGEVVEVRENSYGGAVSTGTYDLSDTFILFCKTGSSNAQYVKDLKAGDTIDIAVTETVADSKEIMENANSVITNVGWLVKDGVDQTQIESSIGTHSVTTEARWTAFGTKEDGSYVFFTTEGKSTYEVGSVTLRDVAKAMIELGCTNVIRMDGGGSSAMYVKSVDGGDSGYLQSSTRSVGDCILVVTRASLGQESELKTKLSELATSLEGNQQSAYVSLLAEAKEVLNSETSVEADYRRVYQNLNQVSDAYAVLKDGIENAAKANKDDYTPSVWSSIEELTKSAEEISSSTTATLSDVTAAGNALKQALAATGDQRISVSDGCSYTYDKTKPSSSYADAGGVLTNGEMGTSSVATDGTWVGISGTSIQMTVDLGSVRKNISSFNVSILNKKGWGITGPESVKISVSEDGTNYTSVVTLNPPEGYDSSSENTSYNFSGTLENAVNAKYVRFTFVNYGWVFIGELQAFADELTYGNGGGEETEPFIRGDVDGNGAVEAKDYLKLKRYVLGTYVAADGEEARMDVNLDENVNAKDYIMLKRVVLGTYSFAE